MDDIAQKETLTITHYDNNAEAFWLGTKDHDVSQNIRSFLDALPKGEALDILDLGCGPGRDLLHFKSLGHNPTGLDGSKTFCDMASTISGCPTINESFVNMSLPSAQFDGVFANASLFHAPRTELSNVLLKLFDSLKPGGVLFASNPRGNSEGYNGQRYGYYMELDTFRELLESAGFELLHHYYRPEGKPIAQQPWLATVSRRA